MNKITCFLTFVFLILFRTSFGQVTTLLTFDGANNGSYPEESLLYDGTFLYGMTSFGGVNNKGTIFKIRPDGTDYQKLFDFGGVETGSIPRGSLITDGTYLYGLTQQGGENNLGTVFKILSDGTGYEKLLDFQGSSNGAFPNSTLFFDGSFLYGMTAAGGTVDDGVLFKIKPDGSNYVKLLTFNGASTGAYPEGPLISDGTYLYGQTPGGGMYDNGIVFRIKPDGTDFFKLHEFMGGIDGSVPRNQVVSDGIYLYGMTTQGGTSGYGTIYRIKPDGSDYLKVYDFADTTQGFVPGSSLCKDGNYFYGVALGGGVYHNGVLFKILPDGTGYTKLVDFNGMGNGKEPIGYLISDGTNLYGMTTFGGANDLGVIYKYSVTAGLQENNEILELRVFPNPTTGKLFVETKSNGIEEVIITNLLGEMVFKQQLYFHTETPVELDLSNLPEGCYMLKIGNSMQRIIR